MSDMLERTARLIDGIDTDLDVSFLGAPAKSADVISDEIAIVQAFSNVVSFSPATPGQPREYRLSPVMTH
ncbi:MAG: hypothetical protein EBS76_10790, partial [Actinobacteria bacterium]|nr:hypothetical protein [Actinomycetota bacterium]